MVPLRCLQTTSPFGAGRVRSESTSDFTETSGSTIYDSGNLSPPNKSTRFWLFIVAKYNIKLTLNSKILLLFFILPVAFFRQ